MDSQENQNESDTGYEIPDSSPDTRETTPDDPEVDEFGYEKVKSDTPPSDETPTEEVKEVEDDTKIEKPSTGYGDEPPKEEAEPVVEKTEAEKTEEEKVKGEITEALKELGDNFDKEKITKFAVENKLSKDQVAAYAKFAKGEQAAVEAQVKKQIAAQRASWHKELKEDAEFGGENFRKNVDRAEKVLQKYFPNMKKQLDDKKSVLPPYLMRDLALLSKQLNPTTKLVTGDAVEKKKESSGFEPDDFYS